jgi:hypothetical protein
LFHARATGRDRQTEFSARTGSLGVAETSGLRRLQVGRANASEPERKSSAAIAAIVISASFNWLGPVTAGGDYRWLATVDTAIVELGIRRRP